ENVETYAEQGLLSKQLATILLDAPVELEIEKLAMEDPDREKLEQLFSELEFRTLGKRVFGEDFTVTGGQAAQGQTDLFGNPVPGGGARPLPAGGTKPFPGSARGREGIRGS